MLKADNVSCLRGERRLITALSFTVPQGKITRCYWRKRERKNQPLAYAVRLAAGGTGTHSVAR